MYLLLASRLFNMSSVVVFAEIHLTSFLWRSTHQDYHVVMGNLPRVCVGTRWVRGWGPPRDAGVVDCGQSYKAHPISMGQLTRICIPYTLSISSESPILSFFFLLFF